MQTRSSGPLTPMEFAEVMQDFRARRASGYPNRPAIEIRQRADTTDDDQDRF